MNIELNHNSSTPMYMQLKNHIKSQILAGTLPAGFKLPSERKLAEMLQIHRNTVIKAYNTLTQEGFIFSSQKAPRGYFVGNAIEEEPCEKCFVKKPFSSLDRNFNYHFTSMQNKFQELYNSSYMSSAISFAGIVMHPESLPFLYLKQILKEISEGDSIEPFWHCDPQGMPALRKNLAKMLFHRNIYVNPQNIQVIRETTEAISNIAYMYLEKGDYVIVEEPACPNIVNIFLHIGAIPIFVPMEEDGISIDILEKMIQKYHPKLIYTMPNYHNPSSITMSIQKRKQFLECVLAHSIPIIEEDSQNELHYHGAELPSLYSLDHTNSVIYIDSSTLSFFPGARLGYIVAPDNVIKIYRQIINTEQLFLNSLSQCLWSSFFEKGYYEKHKTFLRDFYKKKRDLICKELQTIPEISFHIPEGGVILWIHLEENIHDKLLTSVTEKMGLLIMPGYTFFPNGSHGENYLRICFSGVTDEEVIEGVSILKAAIAYCKNKEY